MTSEHKAIKESLITHWAKDPTNALLAKAAHAIEALSAEVKRLRALVADYLQRDWDAMEAERDRLAAENAKLRDKLAAEYHSSKIFQRQQAREAAEQIAATSRNMDVEEKAAHDAFFQEQVTASEERKDAP